MIRDLLLRVHLWLGVALAAYVGVIGVTGSILVFRPELQAAAYPAGFQVDRAAGASVAEPSAIVKALLAAYPGHRLAGIDWPTYRRQTYLAYMTQGTVTKTVFVNPFTARIIGELEENSTIRTLQELHFSLVAGRRGHVVNGIAAVGLLAMLITGLLIWWPRAVHWWRRLAVDWSRDWRRISRELHGAIGVWAACVLFMWTLTGIYFVWPQPLRQFARSASTQAGVAPPVSNPAVSATPGATDLSTLIRAARSRVPNARVARFIPAFGRQGTDLIAMARAVHGDFDSSDEVSLSFDQYSGTLLLARDHGVRSTAESVIAWIGPLHFGSFGGAGRLGPVVKLTWAVSALSLPLLAATGLIMWSNRWSSRRRKRAGAEAGRTTVL